MNDFRLLGGSSDSSASSLSLPLSGGNNPPSFQQEFDNYCKLSKKQRMRGFVACFVTGWILTACSLIVLFKPAYFAILYTLGNVTALLSTCFLWGPKSQCKAMFKPIRAGATILYLVSMIFTLVIAFTIAIGPLVLLGLAVQFCAMVWYAASYIPYGRAMIKKMIGGVCKSVNGES